MPRFRAVLVEGAGDGAHWPSGRARRYFPGNEGGLQSDLLVQRSRDCGVTTRKAPEIQAPTKAIALGGDAGG